MRKRRIRYTITLMFAICTLAILCLPVSANLCIISYNIKDFWLRFDGESGTIVNTGAELDQRDLKKLEIIADVIDKEKPDVIGILDCASLAELLFFNGLFLNGQYKCWGFRAYDSRSYGIPLGIMVKKGLEATVFSHQSG